ncbi:MAG: hypothetical protein IJ649_09095, partial [Oscillospiraceae bacterium]|nr:hypothetical protein [Oscillospiraceae bacterium]
MRLDTVPIESAVIRLLSGYTTKDMAGMRTMLRNYFFLCSACLTYLNERGLTGRLFDKETLDAAGEQSEENDPVEEALWQRVPFNPEMIPAEAKAQLAQESPAFAEALRQTEQTGEEASIAYSDFVTQVARSESATEFVKATHVPMEMSNGEIALVALNQTEEAAQELAEEQRATFRTSLKAVAKEIAAMLEAVPEPDKGRRQTEGKMGVGEKKAVAALVLSHVSAMARDLGITPEEA